MRSEKIPVFDEKKLADYICAFGDMLHEQAEDISKLAMSGKTTEINITEHIGVDYIPYLEINMNQYLYIEPLKLEVTE